MSACRAALVCLAVLVGLCGTARVGLAAEGAGEALIELAGAAFGTSWHVRLPVNAESPAPEALVPAIESLLEQVDARLSTWRDDSEVSRFNASVSTDWRPVSRDTAAVAAAALFVHARSGGAFDPTVAPLVSLWGFGAEPAPSGPPTDAAVDAALRRVDGGALGVRQHPPALRKARPDLSLDLSGVAKGFAVDAVARRLRELGVRRFLVEIGGELRSLGEAPGGGPWRVGVERPVQGPRHVDWVLALEDAALATSGDYRNRVTWRGRGYSHVIDPRSGRPVQHPLVSVSVLAREAARADAWATALLVLGPEAGWRVAEHERLAALFVTVREGRLEARGTPALERHRVY